MKSKRAQNIKSKSKIKSGAKKSKTESASMKKAKHPNKKIMKPTKSDSVSSSQMERINPSIDKEIKKFLKLVSDAVFVVNDNLIIREANKKALNLIGVTKDKIIGSSIKNIFVKNSLKSFTEFWKDSSHKNNQDVELNIKRKDGVELTVELNIIKDFAEGNNIITFKDITYKKQLEMKLEEIETRWKFALESVGDGVWDWNAKTNKVYFSSTWKRMLGYSDDEISDSIEEWSSRIHPDDKEKCFSDLKKYLKGETSIYINEHRLLCKDGSYKWILDRGRIVEYTKNGKPLRLVGTHTDIDMQKKIIAELERKNSFIQTILDNLPIGLATNEFNSGLANYVNDKFSEIYGWPKDKIKDVSKFFELVYPDPEYRKVIKDRISRDIQSGKPERMKWDNIKITTERGEDKYISAVNIPIPEQNLMVSTVQDITDKKRANDKLIEHNKSLVAILEISNQLTSSLDLNRTLQSIVDNVTHLLNFDSGAIYQINGNDLYLAATTPPLDPNFPDIFRHAFISDHPFINKTVKSKKPLFLYDTSKVELSPAEKNIVETRKFRSLFYLPIQTQKDVIAILIVGTVGRLKELNEIEIDVCRSLSNISALAISNADLYQKSKQYITQLEDEVRERIKIEKELKASEDKFSKAFKTNPDAININRVKDGVYLEANDGFSNITGYSYEDIIGKSSLEINIWVNPSDRKYLIDQLTNKGFVNNYEAQFRMKDGTIKTGLMSASIIEIGGEKCILSITRDITERKKAEEELKEKQIRLAELNQLLQNILNTVPSRIFWKDNNLMYLGCNKPFANDAGKESPEELIGLSDYDMGWKDQAKLYRADDQQVINSGIPKLNYEEPQTTPSGNIIWLKTSKVPLRDLNGNIIGVLGTYEDITEKKLAEQALRESEERYKALFNNNHSVMLLINPSTGQIVDANPAACRYYGYSHAEMVNKKIMEINILSPAEIVREMEAAKNEKRNRFFFKHRLANGEIRDVEVFSGSVVIDSETYLYSIVHDITEQKLAQEALKISEERLNQATRVALIGIYDHDHINNILYYSPYQRKIFGYDQEEEITLAKFIDSVHPEDKKWVIEEGKKAHDPDGKGLFDAEFRIIRRDGTERWVSIRAQTYFNEQNGKVIPIRTIGATIDITERKQFEKRLTDSLKEKEILLKEVHHRVKNNFQVIISLLSLQSELINDPSIIPYFTESRNRIKSMALTHELLYRQTNFDSLDVRHYIDNLVDYLKRTYVDTKSDINIISDVDNICIDIDRIIPCGLIINELISNSMKHAFPTGRKGEIIISFKECTDDNYYLTVKDNGIGISKELDLGKLKSLGMMLINTLTKQLEGELIVNSSDLGSEFIIKFPSKKDQKI